MFGINAGFRFINKLKYGLFIESGAGISWVEARYPQEEFNVHTWGQDWTYYEDNITNRIFASVPFLIGYKTQKGKIRFQAGAGISFNIKFIDFKKVTISGSYPYGIPGTESKGFENSFGTGFSAIARAGISIPLKNKLWIDILPTFRYNYLSFMPEEFDITECMNTNMQNWSAGLDISLVWALDNKPRQTINETVKHKDKEQDYTFQYNPDDPSLLQKKEKVKKGPYNFLYFEAGGPGLLYSFNYERTLFRKDIFSLQARAGYCIGVSSYAIPVGVNVAFGHATQKFEGGIYVAFEDIYPERFSTNLVPEIAYRLETEEHFFLRLALMSHYITRTGEILPGIGVSVGGCF